MQSPEIEFKVGDKAVYPAQGVAEVISIDEKDIAGSRQRFYVLRILDTDRKIMVPVSNAIDFMFDALLKSFTFVDPILKADREAVRGREEYDDSYFDQFFGQVRPILERRLNDSMTAVASMIVSAWEKGGRPDLPLEVKHVPKKVKREQP